MYTQEYLQREVINMSKGIDELRGWAMHNVRLISILPSNKNLHVDTKLTDVLEEDVDEKYYLSEEQTNKLLSDYQFSDAHQGGIMTTRHKITKETDISHSLMARDYKGIGNQEMTAVKEGHRIRKLTPLECWRLQGFTDEQFYKAKNSGVSNSQLYKQAGNSVTVNVIDAIARRLR